MIKQHYYTRCRRGIYSLVPGYDTVAKSKALSDTFIKRVLHKYCFYDVPFSLASNDDYTLFPKVYICYNTSGGDMVLGCSSYDRYYEDKKAAFFTHNYIIPENEKEIFIKNPKKILYAAGFISSFNNKSFQADNIIEEIEAFEIDEGQMIDLPLSELLMELGIKERTFKQLLLACINAVLENKKIYIILDVDISLISKYAKGILNYLYKGLPYEIRRKLGYITYAANIKNREYIHLEFLSKDAIKSIDAEVKADYLFDFNKHRFITNGLDYNEHFYIDFILKNIEDTQLIDELLAAADKDFGLSNKHDISEYDKFTAKFFGYNDEYERIIELENKNIKSNMNRAKSKVKKLIKSSAFRKLLKFIERK